MLGNATDAGARQIDEALIAIYGYSMSTLIEEIPEDTNDREWAYFGL